MENETENLKAFPDKENYNNLYIKERFCISKFFSLQIIYIILITP